MTILRDKMSKNVQEIVRDLWRLYQPKREQGEEFMNILDRLEKTYGFASLPTVCAVGPKKTDEGKDLAQQDSEEGDSGLVGDYYVRLTKKSENNRGIEKLIGGEKHGYGVFRKKDDSLRARMVLDYSMQNAMEPVDMRGHILDTKKIEQGFKCFVLVRHIPTRLGNGVEIFVFDKGRSIVNDQGYNGIFDYVDSAFSAEKNKEKDSNSKFLLREAIRNSDNYEIDSSGMIGYLKRGIFSINLSMGDAPYMYRQGTLIRAVVKDRWP
jgi:hypothetical protein